MNIAWFIMITFVVIGIQTYIYSKWGLSRIQYTRSFSEVGVFEGEEIEMIDEVSNKKILLVPWLRLESKIDENLKFTKRTETDNEIDHGGFHRTLFSLMPYQKVRRRQQITCTKRGFYHFENVNLSSGDIFGLGEISEKIQSTAEITVYPRLIRVDDIPLPAHSWLGDIVVRRWIIEDPFLTAGVRDYSAGDPLNAVNWKATARTSNLQVTKKDFSADHYLMIYVNFDQTGDIWFPIIDEQLIETSITYAASIAAYSISKGISTGFGCNSYIGEKSNKPMRIEPENSKQQLMYLFETMAKLAVDANKGINFYLKEDIDRSITGTDILLITAIVSEGMQENINRLEALGNSVEVLLLESEIIHRKAM